LKTTENNGGFKIAESNGGFKTVESNGGFKEPMESNYFSGVHKTVGTPLTMLDLLGEGPTTDNVFNKS